MLVGYGFSPRGHIAEHSGGSAAVSAAVARANASTRPTPNLLPPGWRLGARWRPSRDGYGDVLPSHWSDGVKLYSYGTCLLEYDSDTGDLLYNDTHYSVTTARWQDDARRVARAAAQVTGGRVRYMFDVPRGTIDLRAFRAADRSRRNRLGVAE